MTGSNYRDSGVKLFRTQVTVERYLQMDEYWIQNEKKNFPDTGI